MYLCGTKTTINGKTYEQKPHYYSYTKMSAYYTQSVAYYLANISSVSQENIWKAVYNGISKNDHTSYDYTKEISVNTANLVNNWNYDDGYVLVGPITINNEGYANYSLNLGTVEINGSEASYSICDKNGSTISSNKYTNVTTKSLTIYLKINFGTGNNTIEYSMSDFYVTYKSIDLDNLIVYVNTGLSSSGNTAGQDLITFKTKTNKVSFSSKGSYTNATGKYNLYIGKHSMDDDSALADAGFTITKVGTTSVSTAATNSIASLITDDNSDAAEQTTSLQNPNGSNKTTKLLSENVGNTSERIIYKIRESSAPDGYNNLEMTIYIAVTFFTSGDTIRVSGVHVYDNEGNYIASVKNTKYIDTNWVNNYETLKIDENYNKDADDSNYAIEIYVQYDGINIIFRDPEVTGQYNLYLGKHSMDDDSALENAEFTVEPQGYNYASGTNKTAYNEYELASGNLASDYLYDATEVTTSLNNANGNAQTTKVFSQGVKSSDYRLFYKIEETSAPEGYCNLGMTIYISATFFTYTDSNGTETYRLSGVHVFNNNQDYIASAKNQTYDDTNWNLNSNNMYEVVYLDENYQVGADESNYAVKIYVINNGINIIFRDPEITGEYTISVGKQSSSVNNDSKYLSGFILQGNLNTDETNGTWGGQWQNENSIYNKFESDEVEQYIHVEETAESGGTVYYDGIYGTEESSINILSDNNEDIFWFKEISAIGNYNISYTEMIYLYLYKDTVEVDNKSYYSITDIGVTTSSKGEDEIYFITKGEVNYVISKDGETIDNVVAQSSLKTNEDGTIAVTNDGKVTIIADEESGREEEEIEMKYIVAKIQFENEDNSAKVNIKFVFCDPVEPTTIEITKQNENGNDIEATFNYWVTDGTNVNTEDDGNGSTVITENGSSIISNGTVTINSEDNDGNKITKLIEDLDISSLGTTETVDGESYSVLYLWIDEVSAENGYDTYHSTIDSGSAYNFICLRLAVDSEGNLYITSPTARNEYVNQDTDNEGNIGQFFLQRVANSWGFVNGNNELCGSILSIEQTDDTITLTLVDPYEEYDYSFDLGKIDNSNSPSDASEDISLTNLISGATFEIYGSTGTASSQDSMIYDIGNAIYNGKSTYTKLQTVTTKDNEYISLTSLVNNGIFTIEDINNYNYHLYKIVETSSPDGYVDISEENQSQYTWYVAVTFMYNTNSGEGCIENVYIFDGSYNFIAYVSYKQDSGKYVLEKSNKGKNASDNMFVNGSDVNSIVLTASNVTFDEYSISVAKKGVDSEGNLKNGYIAGATVETSASNDETDNNTVKTNLTTATSIQYLYIDSSALKYSTDNKKIQISSGTSDSYTFKETAVPTGSSYTLNDSEITINLNKTQSDDGKYSISSISLSSGTSTIVENLSSDTTYYIQSGTSGYTYTTNEPSNYSTTIASVSIDSSLNITYIIYNHTETVDIPVKKVWSDSSFNCDSYQVTVEVYAGSNATGNTLTLDATNNWIDTFSNLDKYDSDGNEIEYTVVETKIKIDLDEDGKYEYEVASTKDECEDYVVSTTNESGTFVITNKPIEWTYSLDLGKISEDDVSDYVSDINNASDLSKYLESGASFDIYYAEGSGIVSNLTSNSYTKLKSITTSGSDFENIISSSYDRNDINDGIYHIYKIVETSSPDGYISITDDNSYLYTWYVVVSFLYNENDESGYVYMVTVYQDTDGNGSLTGSDKTTYVLPNTSAVHVYTNSGAGMVVNAQKEDGNDYYSSFVVTATNEQINGKYYLQVIKTDSNGDNLTGASFSLTRDGYADNLLPNSGSTTSGRTSTATISIVNEPDGADETSVTTTDYFTLQETTVPDGYIGLSTTLKLEVTKTTVNDEYVMNTLTVYENGNTANKIELTYSDSKTSEGILTITDSSGNEFTVSVELDESGTITISVTNVLMSGAYSLDVLKVDENGDSVSGIEFTITGTNDASDVNIDSTTDKNGKIETDIIEITNTNDDVLTITEINSDNDDYIGLASALNVTVSKKSDSSGYYVEKITVKDTGTNNETSISKGSSGTLNVYLEDGSTVTLNIKLSSSGEISMTIVNNTEQPPTYKLQLLKVDSEIDGTGNYTTVLKGRKFAVYASSTQTSNTEEWTLLGTYTTDDSGYIEIPYEFEMSSYSGTDYYYIQEVYDSQSDEYIQITKYYWEVGITYTQQTGGSVTTRQIYALYVTPKAYDKNDTDQTQLSIADQATRSYDSSTGTVTITIVNKKKTPFDFELVKYGENISGTYSELDGTTFKVTVTKESAQVASSSGDPYDGDTDISFSDAQPGDEYEFTISETSTVEGYENVIGDSGSISFTIVIDDDGIPTWDGTYTKNNNVSSEFNTILSAFLDKIGKQFVEIDTSGETPKVIVNIPNKLDTQDFDLYLYKYAYGNTKNVLSDVTFSVTRYIVEGQISSASELSNVTSGIKVTKFTSGQNGNLIDSVEKATVGKTYYYEITETGTLTNFNTKIDSIIVGVTINSDGTMTKAIYYVKESGSSDYIAYENSSYKDRVYLDASSSAIAIDWINDISFKFTVDKYGFSGSLDEITTDSKGNIVWATDANGGNLDEVEAEFFYTLNNGLNVYTAATLYQCGTDYTDGEVFQTSTGEYTEAKTGTYYLNILEIGPTDNYSEYINVFENVRICVEIKVGEDGSITSAEIYGFYSTKTGNILNDTNKAYYSKYVDVEVDGNEVKVHILDPESTETIGIYKRSYSSNSNVYKLVSGVTFDVYKGSISAANKIGSITTSSGFSSLTSTDLITYGAVNEFYLVETIDTSDITALENSVKVTIDARLASSADDLADCGISISFVDDNGNEVTDTTLTPLLSAYIFKNMIFVTIPNITPAGTFTLNKVDEYGNTISGNNLKFNITSESTDLSETTILDSDTPLTSGTFEDTMVLQGNREYIYTITEQSTENGYVNILQGYNVEVHIKTDSTGKIITSGSSIVYSDSDEDYSYYTFVKNGSPTIISDLSELQEFITINVDTSDLYNQAVTVYVENPTGYRAVFMKKDSNEDYISAELTATVEDVSTLNIYKSSVPEQSSIVTSDTLYLGDSTHTWKITETDASEPYTNILENKYALVDVSWEDGILVASNLRIYTNDGDDLTSDYTDYVSVSTEYVDTDSDGTSDTWTLYLTVLDPINVQLQLNKVDSNGDPVTGAELTFERIRTDGNGTYSYTSESGEISGSSSSTGYIENEIALMDSDANMYRTDDSIITYKITEISTATGHVNVLNGKDIYLNFYYDGNDLKWAPNWDYMTAGTEMASILQYINVDITYDSDSRLYTVDIYVENPIEFKVQLTKVDSDGNELGGTEISIKNTTTDKTYYLSENSTLTFTESDGIVAGNTIFYEIKELYTSQNGNYINVIEGYKLYVLLHVSDSGTISLYSYYMSKYDSETHASTIIEKTQINEDYGITISVTDPDSSGLQTLEIEIENPTNFELDVVKYRADSDGSGETHTGSTISGVVMTTEIYDSEGNQIGGQSGATTDNDGTISELISGDVGGISAGNYTIRVYENSVNAPYVNILGTNYIEIKITLASDGTVTINSWGYYYSNGGSVSSEDKAELDKYISVSVDETLRDDGTLSLSKVVVEIENPVSYIVEALKTDTDGKSLSGATMKLTNVSTGEEIEAVTGTSGTVTSTQSPVVPGIYRWDITEIEAASDLYYNILDGYKVVVYLSVSETGSVTIVKDANGTKYASSVNISQRFAIYDENDNNVTSTAKTSQGILIKNYVYLKFSNTVSKGVRYKVTAVIENPVNIKLDINKVDTSNDTVSAKFRAYTNIKGYAQVIKYSTYDSEGTEITSSYSTTSDDVEYDITGVSSGTYKFYLEEISTEEGLINVLKGKTLCVEVDIKADGEIEVVSYTLYEGTASNAANLDALGSEATAIDKDDELYDYIKEVSINGNTIVVDIVNPTEIEWQIVKTNAGSTATSGSKFTVYVQKDSGSLELLQYNSDVNVLNTLSMLEAGSYTLYLTENQTIADNYVNVLDGKFLVVYFNVSARGKITITDSSHYDRSDGYYDLYSYSANLGDLSDEITRSQLGLKQIVSSSDEYEEISQYIKSVGKITNNSNVDRLSIIIQNPVKYNLNITKFSADGETNLAGTIFEVTKIDKDMLETVKDSDKYEMLYYGYVTEDTEITDENITAGNYVYRFKEISTASNSYDNILEDKYVKVGVRVASDGTMSIPYYIAIYSEGTKDLDGDEVEETYNSINSVSSSESAFLYEYLTKSSESTSTNIIYTDSTGYIKVILSKDSDGIWTVNFEVTNPVKYNLDIVKYDTDEDNLEGAKFTVSRYSYNDQTNTLLLDNGNVTESVEIAEENMKAGEYVYYVTENSTNTNAPYINVLDGKILVIPVTVNQDGTVDVDDENIELYKGTISSDGSVTRKGTVSDDDEVWDYIGDIYASDDDGDGIYTITVEIINPINYEFELVKQNAKGSTVHGSSFTVIRTNKYGNDEETIISSSDSIYDNVVTESPMNSGTYYYYVTENSAPDTQYENIFVQEEDGITYQYYIRFSVEVGADGELTYSDYAIYRWNLSSYATLEDYLNNGSKSSTVANDYISEYVTITTSNYSKHGSQITLGKIQVTVKDPVKYNLNITKTDTDGDYLDGTTFTVAIIDDANGTGNASTMLASGANMELLLSNATVSELTELENIVTEAGQYTLYVTENSTASNSYNNILEGRFLKIWITVFGDGRVTISQVQLYEGDITSNEDSLETIKQKIINNDVTDNRIAFFSNSDTTSSNSIIWTLNYESENDNASGLINVVIDQYSNVTNTTNNKIFTIDIQVTNPVKYKLDLAKYDTDEETLDDSSFTVARYKSNASFSKTSDYVVLFDNEVVSEDIEVNEEYMEAGYYIYYITENETKDSDTYVNILKGKVIRAYINVLADGTVKIVKWDICSGTISSSGVSIQSVLGSDDEAYEYVHYNGISEIEDDDENEGVNVISFAVENPTFYYVKLEKQDAAGDVVSGSKFTILRTSSDGSNLEVVVDNGDITNTITESPMRAGNYIYYITETKTPGYRYVNILDGKYVKIYVTVEANGKMYITNSKYQQYPGYFEVYEYDTSSTTLEDLIENGNSGTLTNEDFSTYVSTDVEISEDDGQSILRIYVLDPIKYIVDITKVDTENNTLYGTNFTAIREIVSTQISTNVFDEKDPSNSNEDVTEEPMLAGNYIYYFTENETAGDNYANVLDGKYIKVYVTVAGDGTVTMMNSDFSSEDDDYYEVYVGNINNRKSSDTLVYTNDGIDDTYEDDDSKYIATFISVGIVTNENRYYYDVDSEGKSIVNYNGYYTIGVTVQNPVNYKVIIDKTIWGAEEQELEDATFYIWSSFSGTHENLETDNEGNITIQEEMVSAGTYTYLVTEQETPGDEFVNVLDGKALRITVEISGSGEITLVGYEVVEIDLQELLSTEVTQEYVNNLTVVENVGITDDRTISIETEIDENNVSELHIKIKDPQKYEFGLIKTDKDTGKAMNDVEFGVTVTKYDDESETWNEISINNAYTFETINTSSLVTANIDGQDGVISITDILIESEGTYRYSLHEQTIDESIFGFLYKTHAEDIVIEITIEIENGKYVISEMSTIAGGDYVSLLINDDGHLTTGVKNERIKGKYDLEFTKIDSYTESPLAGATFEVTAEKDGEEYTLYQSNDDVESQDVLIPTTVTTDENGYFEIENIRIEHIETYTIILTEIEAPEGYMLLDEPIRLTVTTTTEGEYDDEKFVIESVVLESDIYGLVEMDYDEDEIEVEAKNEYFDLALRKSITSVSYEDGTEDGEITEEDTADRVPDVDSSDLMDDTDTTAIYNHNKEPIRVYAGQYVIYTLRVYNEGEIDGYAEEVTDFLPEWLEYVDDEFNSSWGWELDETDSTGRTVKTTYLSEANGTVDSDGVNSNMIKAFNQYTGEVDYKEVRIKCKVSDDAVAKTILTNIAEITISKASNRTSETVDRDSTTNNVELPEDWPSYKNDELTKDYVPGQEDDDDFEKVIVEEFDLSLRKYITAVNGESLSEEEDRSPNITLDGLNDGSSTTALYEHTKDPKEVIVGDYVTYTIAIYNEGTVDGYATSIEDDIPDGLEFVIDSAINEKYGWVILDENKEVTDDVTKAKYVSTNYLSKDNGEDNLIKAYDGETLDTKYVQVEFKVVLEETSEEIVENKAQITDDSDEHGRPVKDRDSVPNEWNAHEDDQDIERIKILYFDLSLRKWVTQAIVTVNGETTVTETGHQAEDDPEEVVKVDLKKSKVNEVVVKFKYSIRITNEGRIAGYATEIKDYIPEGLTFNATDNPNWVEIEDGIITTDALANTLLQPGESAEVEVILTWVNSETNMGVKVNVAEISKDYNDYGAPDIDSTPDNYVEGEDDIDDAPVMLTVKTGAQTIAELSIALAILVLLALGIKLKKKTAEKNAITDDKFLNEPKKK